MKHDTIRFYVTNIGCYMDDERDVDFKDTNK